MAIIQLIDSLGLGRGGLTKAIYDRLTFASSIDETILLVTGVQFNVKEIGDILKKNKQIPDSVKVLGIFDEAFGCDIPTVPPLVTLYKDNLYEMVEKKEGSVRAIRYFNNQGQYIGLESFDGNGKLNFLEIHSTEFPHICSIRQFYDAEGRVRSVKYFDFSWKPRFETVFRSDGSPIYSCWLKEDNGDRYRISYFNILDGKKVAELCSDSYDLRAKLIAPILDKYPNSVLLSDEPSTILFLSRNYPFNQKVRKGVGYIHTTHTYKVADGSEQLKPWYFSYKLNSGSLSVIVSTNHIQANELRETIPLANTSNVLSISHPIQSKVEVSPKKEPTYHLLFLGRLSNEKRVDLVIKGFAHALKSIPNLILDIVGDGPLAVELKQLAKRLGIEKSVIFHGYTLEVNKWFQQADCHFLVSKFEGFPLVLVEGLSNGCPCIVTPCKYGPDQVIEHNNNGIRVPDTAKDVGEAIVSLYKNNLLQKLSEGALVSAQKYDKELWQKKWLEILK